MQVIKRYHEDFYCLCTLNDLCWKKNKVKDSQQPIRNVSPTKKKQVCSSVFTYLLISLFCWYCQGVSSELTNLKETDKAKEITELELHNAFAKKMSFYCAITFHHCPVIEKFLLQKCFYRSRAEHTCTKPPCWMVHTAHLCHHLHLPPKNSQKIH